MTFDSDFCKELIQFCGNMDFLSIDGLGLCSVGVNDGESGTIKATQEGYGVWLKKASLSLESLEELHKSLVVYFGEPIFHAGIEMLPWYIRGRNDGLQSDDDLLSDLLLFAGYLHCIEVSEDEKYIFLHPWEEPDTCIKICRSEGGYVVVTASHRMDGLIFIRRKFLTIGQLHFYLVSCLGSAIKEVGFFKESVDLGLPSMYSLK